MQKFAVSYRLDNQSEEYARMIEAIESVLADHMLEPARMSTWQHLTTIYYITDSDGPKIAMLLDLIYDDYSLVYAGPL